MYSWLLSHIKSKDASDAVTIVEWLLANVHAGSEDLEVTVGHDYKVRIDGRYTRESDYREAVEKLEKKYGPDGTGQLERATLTNYVP